MKSKTSCFNAGIFRRDITRFYPVWVLYTFFVLLNLGGLNDSYVANRVRTVCEAIPLFAVFNAIYAPIVASLLFGDLFTGRLCNGVHAMPVRRETMFFTHLLSGLLFSLIPNCLYALVSMLSLGGAWYLGLIWLAAVTMSYLCFFGIALFATHCTGSRFAMLAVYGGLVCLPMILGVIYLVLYQPLLYGVNLTIDPFFRYSPLNLDTILVADVLYSGTRSWKLVLLPSAWLWYGGYLAVGVILGALALVFYRKRDLEGAGDFLTVSWLKPVLLVICPIGFTLAIYFVFSLFFYGAGLLLLLPFLLLGLLLTQMVLQRTTRVLNRKTFLSFAVLACSLAVTLGLTALDPLGVTKKIPAQDEISYVSIGENPYYNMHFTTHVRYREPEDVETARQLHQAILDQRNTQPSSNGGIFSTDLSLDESTVNVYLEYRLRSGGFLKRCYEIPVDSPAGELYGKILSKPEYVLSTIGYTDWDSFRQAIVKATIDNIVTIPEEELDEFMEVLKADFDAGNMIQSYLYHLDSGSSMGLELQSPGNGIYLHLWEGDCLSYQWLVDKGYVSTYQN